MRICNSMPSVAAVLFMMAAGAVVADPLDTATPVGAERLGNADGTIPPWTGDLAPSASDATKQHIGDPFRSDKPVFVITAANYAAYAARLSQGHQALFKKYPDYEMRVYPTRRSVLFPDEIYAATRLNLKNAKLVGIDAIRNARLGVPFPVPHSGAEVVWNHRLRYHGDSAEWKYRRAVVSPDGGREISHAVERVLYRYANVKQPADISRENVFAYVSLYIAPCENAYSRIAAVWHDPVNALENGRRVWGIGGGAAKREPALGYDEIGLCSRRIRFFDMVDMFNGGFDRYAFKLIGKREMYVAYNSRLTGANGTKNSALLTPGHFNQTAVRYELHRVWWVEATLRHGKSHTISKRIFYIDEDSWSILLADCYSSDGQLWRFQEGHLLPLYGAKGVDYAPSLTYDLRDGRYFADRLLSEDPPPSFGMSMTSSEFLPSAVKNRYPGL